MKGEILAFCCLGILLLILLIFQMKDIWRIQGNPVSEIKETEDMRQLIVDIPANVFLIEGEKQRIVIEGSERLMSNIITTCEEGLIRVGPKETKKVLFSFSGLFNNRKEKLNIYLSMKTLDKLQPPQDKKYNIRYQTNNLIGLFLLKGDSLFVETKKSKLSCL